MQLVYVISLHLATICNAKLEGQTFRACEVSAVVPIDSLVVVSYELSVDINTLPLTDYKA